MGVSIEKVQWFGRRRWPCDQYKITKNNRAQLNTKRHTKLIYPVTGLIPFLNNQWLKSQNQNQLLTLFLSWRINDSNARIRISTKEFKVNTWQVLAGSALTGKLLRLHRPSQVASCLPAFVYRTVWLIPESRLADWVVYPRQNSELSFWANAKGSTSSSSSNVLCRLFCVFLTGFCFYEGFVIQQKTVLDTNAVKCVYVEYLFIITMRNNIDDSNNKYDLPLILQ